MGKKKKPFFAKHAKSSAMLISLIIHGIIVLVAISFVAFTVITKEEKVFEAKEVKRPKMKLKKLQVPVKIEKRKKQTAKLRKRVVTEIVSAGKFYEAEDYHQDYFENNRNAPYCRAVIVPKLRKLK